MRATRTLDLKRRHAGVPLRAQVYQQVCAACHSVNQLSFRNLVGVAYSEAEVKALAEEQEARSPWTLQPQPLSTPHARAAAPR